MALDDTQFRELVSKGRSELDSQVVNDRLLGFLVAHAAVEDVVGYVFSGSNDERQKRNVEYIKTEPS